MKRTTTKGELLYAVFVYGLLALAIWAMESCSTTKVVSDDSYAHSHREQRITEVKDSTAYQTATKDSIAHVSARIDSVTEVKAVIDSTIINNTIETIITNTVNTDGIIVGTDKVTNRTTSRDHYRIENNTNNRLSDTKDQVTEIHTDSEKQWSQRQVDSLLAIMDSLEESHSNVLIEDKRSWWERLQCRVGEWLFYLIMTAIMAFVLWLGYKYLTGK